MAGGGHTSTRKPDATPSGLEHVYRAAFEVSPRAMIVADVAGTTLHANAAGRKLLQQGSLRGLLQTAAAQLAATDAHQPWSDLLTELDADGAGPRDRIVEVWRLSFQGTKDPVLLCVVGALRDAAAGRAPPAARFDSVLDAAPVMIWTAGPGGRRDWFSAAWLAFTGHSLAQQRGYGWLKALHPEDRDRCAGIYRTCVAAGAAFTMDCRLRRHDGTYRWVMDTGVPRHDEAGALCGYVGSCVDVHERRTSSDLLAEHTRNLRLSGRWREQVLVALSRRMRRPLSLLAEAGALLRQAESKRDLVARLKSMMKQTEDELGMALDDLDEMAGVAQGPIELRLANVPVGELLNLMARSLDPLLTLTGHRLAIDLPEPSLLLRADVARLAQAIGSVVENVCKACMACEVCDGPVTIGVAARRHENALFLRVREQQRGAAAEFVPPAFALFGGEPQGVARARPGMLAGLAIAQRVVQLHGGTLMAFAGDGAGSGEFVIRLPLA